MAKNLLLSDGKTFTLVDDLDYEVLKRWTWHAKKDKSGKIYVQHTTHVGGTPVALKMHRFLMECPRGKVIDHINGDSLDNRRENLRIVSVRENNFNIRRVAGATGLRGVSYNRSSKMYEANVSKDSVKYYLGMFDNAYDAARAYDEKALELFGELALTNEKLFTEHLQKMKK